MRRIIILAVIFLLSSGSVCFAGSAMDSVIAYKRMNQQQYRSNYNWQAERNRQMLEQIRANQEQAAWNQRMSNMKKQQSQSYRRIY